MNSKNLYSAAAIGIDGYVASRDRTKLQINNVEGFKTKMRGFTSDDNSKNLIFTEDLKNVIHIADKPDIDLVIQMIQKFTKQSKEVRFGSYVFGPPVMRLFYHLNCVDVALELFKDNSLDGFFDQLASYQIFLDLLYNNKRYQDVLDTYDIIKTRQLQGGRYPKHVFNLSIAACYKLNTPASFEYATQLWKDATDSGHIPMRKGVAFFAALALNQGNPQMALEIITNGKQTYLTLRTIKALALAAIKRYDDVIPVLRGILEVDNPMAQKQTFPEGAIKQLKKDFEGNQNKDLQADFEKVVGFLEKHGHLTPNTLDDILSTEIQVTAQIADRYPGNDSRYNNNDRYNNNERYNNNDRYNNDRYQRDNSYQRRDDRRGGYERREFDEPAGGRTQRPGLHELN